MRTLAARLSGIPEASGRAPWDDHEYVRGWGVFGLAWQRPRSLQVVLNATSGLLPLASWRPPALRRLRERVAERLGMGRLELAGTMPSGHEGVLMPQRMYLVDESHATLDGQDLGRPVRLDHNPTIGDVPLPARGVLAQGQAMWRVLQQGAPT